MAATYENDGIYELRIREHAFGETTNGNPKIDFECDVIAKIQGWGGSDGGTKVPAESSSYPVTFSLVFATESQREYNLKKLRFAGWDGSNFDDFEMIGTHIICKNENREHKGKTYYGFDLVLPPLEHKELESKPGIKKKLNALLSKELKASQPAVKMEKTATRSGEVIDKPIDKDEDLNPVADDDETPF